ncbi:DUF2059 domain-containing protein [Caulobacter sp.]|uniref:DUF2059 domain-containing protein n=1 Tax=Caulobacter sp. TaxID=78 RepID=UPI003BAF68B8
MNYIRKTILAGFSAACLLSVGAPHARAQVQPSVPTPAAAKAETEVEALQTLNSAAAAVALGTQPISADQLALGDRFVKAMNLRAGLDRGVAMGLELAKGQIVQSVANQPAATKAKFLAAVDEALAGTRDDVIDKMMQGLTRYYAVRLTAAQLTDALAFYESPLGQKSVRDPQVLTEAEKQDMGLYVLNHPAIMEVLGASVGSMEVSRGLTDEMKSRLKVRMCAALKTRGLTSGACPKTS